MKRQLNGLRMLITGASRGIGRSLAEHAVKAGAKVGLAARSSDELTRLANDLAGNVGSVHPFTADVANDEDRQRLISDFVAHFGGIDVLVNNAGVASWAHFADSNEEIMRHIMEVNFFAPAELIRLAVPHLAEGESPAIVNVSSMCGRRGMPAWPEYSASKFALCGLTEAIRGELVRFNIDVLLIVPGLTSSDFSKSFLKNQGRMQIDFTKGQPPEKVAESILRSLENGKAETVLGSDARWMLRMNKLFPRFMDRMIARRVKKLYEP